MAVTSQSALANARRRMVEQHVEGRGITDARVVEAMTQVERHRFVQDASASRAYGPYSLPIGAGQTTPHPHTVAIMAASLRLRGHERLLEIGTGSGYQTAILSLLAAEVWTLERDPVLAERARSRLREMQFDNVHVRVGSGLGFHDHATFHGIHVSAAAPEVPGQLLSQLAARGRLVLPVGRAGHQRLLLLSRRGTVVTTRTLGSCRFQPLLGPSALPGVAWTEHR